MYFRFPQAVGNMWEITVQATTNKIMNPWDQIKQRLEDKIQPEAFRNWVVRTTFRERRMAIRSSSRLQMKQRGSFMEVEYR